jgi:alkylation response protein AidB-like acyl-CoA dehydrogenase
MYQLPEEHEELRAAVRALAEKEIAPHAAEVDEQERYPQEALTALTEAGFHAVHIPEEYSGQGADAVATCIVIEEVARVDASASLIPAVNKLGTQPILLVGVGGAEAARAAVDRLGGGVGVLRAVGAGSRFRHGVDAHPSPPRRRPLGAQRHQVLDHQRR